MRKYLQYPLSQEEKEFPLAYSMVVHHKVWKQKSKNLSGGILEGVGAILYRVKISALKTLFGTLHKRRKTDIIFFFFIHFRCRTLRDFCGPSTLLKTFIVSTWTKNLSPLFALPSRPLPPASPTFSWSASLLLWSMPAGPAFKLTLTVWLISIIPAPTGNTLLMFVVRISP